MYQIVISKRDALFDINVIFIPKTINPQLFVCHMKDIPNPDVL